jgi:hypothetical protein
MHKIYRIMIVIIGLMVLAIVLLDFLGFHGTILLNRFGNGVITNVIDGFWALFVGPGGTSNLMFVAVIGIGLSAAVSAIIYKFIKG